MAWALAASAPGACSGPPQSIEIPFDVRFGDTPLSCEDTVAGVSLTDLRFYVHDVRLLTADGDEARVQLEPGPLWQSEDVTLLDLESGAGSCRNGTPQRNAVIRGLADPGTYTGLRFRVGVPEHLNHADPLLADAPLAHSFMHWHWRTGYKFLRAGVATADDGFWLHLGSSRCEGTVTDVKGCRSGNRPEIDLPSFVAGRHVVVIDLRELAGGIDLENGIPTDCSSGPAETECEQPFAALGIDFASGTSGGAASVFRVESRE